MTEKGNPTIVLTLVNNEASKLHIGGHVPNVDVALSMLSQATRIFEDQRSELAVVKAIQQAGRSGAGEFTAGSNQTDQPEAIMTEIMIEVPLCPHCLHPMMSYSTSDSGNRKTYYCACRGEITWKTIHKDVNA